MARRRTADCGSDGRAPASVSRSGSDGGSGCRTLGPTVGFFLLLGWRLLLGWCLMLGWRLLLSWRRRLWSTRICRLRLR
jgi:hypothetical protein